MATKIDHGRFRPIVLKNSAAENSEAFARLYGAICPAKALISLAPDSP
jgi:hypothetical protein